jgi:nickel superoxide dismutase
MSRLIRRLSAAVTKIAAPTTLVRGHCDLPCGVYDPEQARIEAESCYKIIEKYAANEDAAFRTRAIAIKEERAELVKHHLDVLWHDYFKPEHVEKVPNLHDIFWQATKQASKVKASTDLADAKKLLDLIDQVDSAWEATGGPEKTRVVRQPA